MTRVRVFTFLLTCIVVGILLYVGILYARGYRFDEDTGQLSARGLLVTKSNPDGAQIYINGVLKTATNSTLPLVPGSYQVEIKKDGFRSWSKKLTIEKEVVTETEATLFRIAPALSPITFSGVMNPVLSDDLSKILFSVPATKENSDQEKDGLWVIETINLPIGFSKDPRRITDGDLSGTTYRFSPDGRQIMLDTPQETYLLDVSIYTPQAKRVAVAQTVDKTLAGWEKERENRTKSLTKNLPGALAEILNLNATGIAFSPDETKILYKAAAEATIPKDLIKSVPGASTQTEERTIKKDHTYIYDIKEDKNFLITDRNHILLWYPTSKHILLAGTDNIIIMDYDGTNRQEVYSGVYSSPYAFPTANPDRIIILTNLGANTASANLYSLGLK